MLATLGLPMLVVALVGVRLACVDATPSAAPPECARDTECALVPAAFTCCGECEPAPPFEAVSTELLDEVRGEWADRCAPATRACEPPACASVPEACAARAICDRGACRVAVTSACAAR